MRSGEERRKKLERNDNERENNGENAPMYWMTVALYLRQSSQNPLAENFLVRATEQPCINANPTPRLFPEETKESTFEIDF